MMARPFYLYQRKEIWYVKFRNPINNKLLSGKSTGTDSRKAADKIARKWLYDGTPDNKTEDPRTFQEIFTIDEILGNLKRLESITPTDAKRFTDYFKKCGLIKNVNLITKESETIVSFLLSFWDYENSLYIKEKLLHGHSIGRRRCLDATGAINRYWKPYFTVKALRMVTDTDIKKLDNVTKKDIKDLKNIKKVDFDDIEKIEDLEKIFKPNIKALTEITDHDIEAFTLFIADSKKLAAKTINNIIGAGTVALTWAHKKKLIGSDPGKGLMKFSGKAKKRGILSDKEIQKLFTIGDWKGNEAARLAALLGAQSGMRAGELIALQVRDIGKDRIFVKHSFSSTDGLKAPKNNETREIPILPEIRKDLLKLARNNPHGTSPTSFIFWTTYSPDQPIRTETLSSRFNSALGSIGIQHEEKLARGLCLHGLRHLYSRKMTDVLNERTAKLTGHKTPAMLEHYADHKNEADFQKAIEATSQVFGRILEFDNTEKAAI